MLSSRIDPRLYQLTVQTTLLLWGVLVLGFPVGLEHIIAVIAAALLTQWVGCRYYNLPFVYLSTLNTSLSTLLLLHAQNPVWLALAAVIGIGSKFVLRWENRHIFNPSNIGIVAMLVFTANVWAAPGQWGHGLWLFLLVAGLGLIPMVGWRVMLVSMSFLISYASLLFLRAWWLGDPWAIPEHQLQNGSLLLFSFFMLSDPKTTPADAKARVIFGVSVALIAVILQFKFFLPNAFLYALLLVAPSVFLLNRWFPKPVFEWPNALNPATIKT